MGIYIGEHQVIEIVYKLIIAFALSLIIGWDREKKSRSAGLRTFPLVAIASCSYVMIGIDLFGKSSDALAHIVQGLITGIGFIGGGAILKKGSSVEGTATAASIWNTGAIGVAVACEKYYIAFILTLIAFLILRYIKLVDDIS